MAAENNKWLVIVNPQAAIGKAVKDWPLIEQTLVNEGIAFDAIHTEHPRHAIELAREAVVGQGYRNLVAVGGDGTNNEVINGIFSQDEVPTTEITMGVIPIGTGNDWRRTFGFSLDYRKNAKILKKAVRFAHDIGKLTYYNHGDPQVRYFLNAAGTGLDQLVCESTNALKMKGKGGPARYLGCLVKDFIRYKGEHVQITVDGNMAFDGEILSLSIGNCRYNGGGMMTMRDAIPDDGLLDLTAIGKVPLLKFAANVKKLYDGAFIDAIKEVKTFRGSKVHVVSVPPHAINVETEGETLTNSPFDFEVLPKAINMVVPENHPFRQHSNP